MHHGSSDRNALLLAAAQHRWEMACAVGKPNRCQGLEGHFSNVVCGLPGEKEGDFDVLGGRQHGEEVEGLEDETKPFPSQPRAPVVVKVEQ